MGYNIFGWDLPPGCRISDIPGNRPEDGKLEAIEENFYNKKEERFSKEERKYLNSKNRSKHLEEIVSKAIEYGINIGLEEGKSIREENHYYEIEAVERMIDNSETPSETLKKIIKMLGIKQ